MCKEEMIKRLIVSADDFGLDSSINEAVEAAHRDGILTSASIVVNGACYDEAIGIARRCPRLGVGIHLTFNGEKPVAQPSLVSSIIDSDGRLLEDHARMCVDILTGKVSLEDIAIECEAQIARFLTAGIIPTHIDSHRHIHLFPPVLKALVRILDKYGIKKMRWINMPLFDYRNASMMRCGISMVLKYGNAALEKRYRHPDYFLGFFKSGAMDIKYVTGAVEKMLPGTTEISFHPATDNGRMQARYSAWERSHRWTCDWEREYGLLKNADIKDLILSQGITLINYGDL
jgi:predicted glycoside hydrolase/deacetylase ChbG (UPF0249 family)